MKKYIVMLLVVLALAPVSSSALGFINITDAQLIRLDETTFRLRVTYDWGGIIQSGATVTSGDLGGLLVPPMSETFGVTGANTGFNYYDQQANSQIVNVGSDVVYQRIGNLYGYDFNINDPLVTAYDFLYQGQLKFIAPVTNGFLKSTYVYATENYDGRFVLPTDPSAVPEPASVLLMGLGLTGVVFLKRRK